MKLKSLINRFAAISFAAVLALGCGPEKPVDPEKPEDKDIVFTSRSMIIKD